MEKIFETRFINIKNNFLHFSDSTTKDLSCFRKNSTDPPVLKLEVEGREIGVFTVSPVSHHLADWEIGINLVLAKALKLQEGVSVTVLPVSSVIPAALSVTVCPASEADFEVLELNSHHIQENLLDQLQVLSLDQPFVSWPTPHLHITLIASGASPKSEMVLLTNSTEMHVSPEIYQGRLTRQHAEPQEQSSLIWSGMQKIFRAFVGGSNPHTNEVSEPKIIPEKEIIFRVHALEQETRNPSVIQIHPSFDPGFNCAKAEVLWPSNPDLIYFHVQIQTYDSIVHSEEFAKFPIAYFDKSLLAKFSLEVGSKIVFSSIADASQCTNLTFEGPDNVDITKDEVYAGLKSLAAENNDTLLINSGTIVYISTGIKGKIILDKEMTILSANQIESCTINFSQEKASEMTENKVTKEKIETIPKLIKGWSHLYEELLFSLHSNLRRTQNSVLVVQGQTGSGKSSLIHLVGKQLLAPPNYVHLAFVDCRTLKGKQIDSLRSFFLKLFQECVRLQPSVAVLENLEVFCPPPNTEQGESPESSYCLSVQELIWDMSLSCCEIHNVVVVATTSNNDAFRWPNEITPVERFTMPDLNVEDKRCIVNELLNTEDITCDKELINKIIKISEGYRIQDLHDLSDRIVFNMWKQGGDGKISKVDVIAALADFVPQGMRGVKLFSARAPSAGLGDEDEEDDLHDKWASVGGLEEVKRNLTELIEWPSKYPELFEDAPLKLQTGVVLYGMPGSGKTLVAAELARSSGANFISVKGPELLSKYIGASEQAVRDLFEKANAARPCILFFDEFDSLAPSRGRDTTGVSDRVVNQLLTSLDGVDSPVDSGVWVVAATSRPDLLDKALLRPGRLDTILYCPLPSKEERLEILQILSRKLVFSDNVDLVEVADVTAGFSGADLQAILYSAQLAALEDLLDEVEAEQPSEVSDILVTAEHVSRALATSRPSLSQAERARYDKIYREFERSRIPGETFVPPQQRATLA